MTVSSATKLQINSHWEKDWCKLSQPRPAVFCGFQADWFNTFLVPAYLGCPGKEAVKRVQY